MERLLTKYGIELPELFRGETQVRDSLATRSLPADLKTDFESGRLAVEEAMQRISGSLQKLDPTLVEAARRAANKMPIRLGGWKSGRRTLNCGATRFLPRHATQIENARFIRTAGACKSERSPVCISMRSSVRSFCSG